VPIKLFEYIAARRPIVNFAPIISEPSQIIQNNHLGYNFNTLDFDSEEGYKTFKELVANYNKGVFQNPMPEENLSAFAWESQISLLEKIISNE
jgi:hypothetical protein